MKQYLILFRPYGMLFLGLTPFFGAVTNGEVRIVNLFLLLLVGCLVHIFTFTQNDYYDVEVDQHSTYVANRPLSTGRISQNSVVLIFSVCFIVCILISIFSFFRIFSFIFLIVGFFCMTLYNKFSKQFAGMEYILGLGVICFGLFGALTISYTISFFVVLVVLFGFFQWLFSVGVSANLKDVEFDMQQGIATTPVVLGVRFSGGFLVVPGVFKLYGFFIKICHILIALSIMIFGYASFWVAGFLVPGFLFFLVSVIVLYLSFRILSPQGAKRDSMLVYAGLQEGLSFLLLPIALMSYLIEQVSMVSTGFLLLTIIVWPVFWFRLLFGKRLIPLE